MERIGWENGQVVSDAYVTIDGVNYTVTPEEYEGDTPLSAENLNLMENNIEEAIDSIVQTENEGTAIGTAKIGNIGIEWGRVDITSGTTATSTSPITLYSGTETLTYTYEYNSIPRIMTSFATRYPNQISTAVIASDTSATIGMYVTSANSQRAVGYILIGILADE